MVTEGTSHCSSYTAEESRKLTLVMLSPSTGLDCVPVVAMSCCSTGTMRSDGGSAAAYGKLLALRKTQQLFKRRKQDDRSVVACTWCSG